jgi:hypothetical protein
MRENLHQFDNSLDIAAQSDPLNPIARTDINEADPNCRAGNQNSTEQPSSQPQTAA